MLLRSKGKRIKPIKLWVVLSLKKISFFIPIINLEYASYAIVLKQYDSDNKVIYESEKIEFTLKRQSTTIYSGRPNVHIV